MPIYIIYGKPGGGKSYYATKRLIDELADVVANRYVVTNLPIDVPALNEYLQKLHPDRNCRVIERIRVIAEEEIPTFYRVRSPVEGQGVAYFIDEAQLCFNARAWAATDKGGLLFAYLTQHRKYGDIVFAITQAFANLDKHFRSLSQGYIMCKNHRLIKLGRFRGANKFSARHFDLEPSRSSEPFLIESHTLDPQGVGSCYDTAKGIGVAGASADKGSRAKGISMWWGIAGVAAICMGILIIPAAIAKAFLAAPQPIALAVPASDDPWPEAAGQQVAVPPVNSWRDTEHAVALTCTGFVSRGTHVVVYLSDGSCYTERDPELQGWGRNHVRISGRRYPIRGAPRSRDAMAPSVSLPDPVLPVVQAQATSIQEGSWRLDPDGVRRIYAKEYLGRQ